MRRAFAIAAVLVALSPASSARAAKAPDDPVAVLPFKNLNDDPSLDWLRAGIAETMISDLRKSGAVRVVERDQIDKALGEVMLQETHGTDESTAAKVGKLVGAKTIVVGSFQKAGKDLRINARFVSVETGVVLDTAKTTGPATRVFALQDQVVDRLLGTPPASRPKRKEGQKTLDAYRLYAMALTTASDADRVGYLKRSLALDPDFVYSKDELDALEKRLHGYQEQHEAAIGDVDARDWAKLSDPKTTTLERASIAGTMLGRDVTDRKFRKQKTDAQRILDLHLPDTDDVPQTPDSLALWGLFESCYVLHEEDLALQAGEQYLERYPTGVWNKSIQQQMQSIIDERRKQAEGAEKVKAHFAELDAKRAKLDPKRPGYANELRRIDAERCWYPRKNPYDAWEIGEHECAAFIAKYAKDPAAKDDVEQAQVWLIEARGELGRWNEAIPQARKFLEEHPVKPGDTGETATRVSQIKSLLQYSWPSDGAS